MNQAQQLQIKIDDTTMKGVYANMMSIAHTKEEFVLDFLHIAAAQQQGIAVARVVVSPGHAKRILSAIKENLEKYEAAFGKIEAAKEPAEGGVGFQA